MSGRCEVAIIGGGLGGLALAAGLQERGFDVQLFEAAPELRTATSTLIGLGENAFKALGALSPAIMEKLPQVGVKARQIMRTVQQAKDAQPEVTTQEPSSLLMTFRWAKVQSTLASLVDPARIHCSHRATSYTEIAEEAGGGVLLHFRDQPDVYARFAVAADGVKSALRTVMHPHDPGLRYLGHMNFNALLYNPGGKQTVDAHEPGQLKVYTDVPMGMFNILCMVIDAGGGYTFWQVRIRSDQPAFTGVCSGSSTAIHASAQNNTQRQKDKAWDHGSGGVAPATGVAAWDCGFQKRGAQPSNGGTPSSDMPYLVGGGLGVAGSKARVLGILEGAGFEDVKRVVEATPEAAIFERAMFDRIPLDELPPAQDLAPASPDYSSDMGRHAGLSSPGGHVVLLGDALHAAHSGPGQGARTAFEDAHQLAQALDRHRPLLKGWRQSTDLAPPPLPDGTSTASDHIGLIRVVRDYTAARLVRVCRMQRVAAEGSGIPELREHARSTSIVRTQCPVPATPEDVKQRWQEFSRWFEKYPECQSGDPDSTYWKPPCQ